MKCKYVKENQEKGKCKDYYFSCTRGYCCRLKEWKKRQRVCPYDNKIRSCTARVKGQKELK